MKPTVKEFFDPATWTLTYVVFDPSTRDAVILDPVWDYDAGSATLSQGSVEKILAFVASERLKVHAILETHAHADHISSAQVLKRKIPGAKVGIGSTIQKVQSIFKEIFHLDPSFPTDGRQFDILMEEGKVFSAGSLKIETIYTPGHTPACSSYLIGDAVFTGDAIFMPDYGTGRCDFPGGSADALYTSIHDKLYRLPDTTRTFTAHDYQPNGRALAFESTIGEHKRANVHIVDAMTRADFVAFRRGKDQGLPAPRLLLPSIQLNISAGALPKAESNGISYLKLPLTVAG